MSREHKRTTTRWARLSVGYHRDPKIIAVGPVGELAFLRLLALAREVVESVDQDGAVPYLLAVRELREVTDLYAITDPDRGIDDLLAVLADEGLIVQEGRNVIVRSYSTWQTTRGEIDAVRAETRDRVAAHRARKSAQPSAEPGTESSGEEDGMGVYDVSVDAFTDLRDAGAVKSGRQKVGKHGLKPSQVADAERIVAHLSATRKELLGGSFKVTATWWTDVKRLLSGAGESPAFTADQVCDLIEFALADKFWHAHCQTPAGLAKHAGKLFGSDEYVAWSKTNGKPAVNRPRNHLIRDKSAPSFRGSLAADKKVDWSNVSGDL
jgi:hypothetical protein